MNIPSFPEFKAVNIEMKDKMHRYFSAYPLDASEYTFTNIIAFKDIYDFRVSVLNNSLIILSNKDAPSFFCPVGGNPDLQILFDYMKDLNPEPCIERAPESFVKEYIEGNPKYTATEERDQFDYVYDVKELTDLRGRRFHDKRNKVNKFRNEYKYEYIPLTADIIDECIEFEECWCEVRECEKYYGLDGERKAILTMLHNFEPLNLKGGVIKIDNAIEALTVAEEFSEDTVVIHIEKANPDIPGLYQAINQEFLMHGAADYKFVNREQDLGIEGLRRAKMTYNPVRFIKKYRVTET